MRIKPSKKIICIAAIIILAAAINFVAEPLLNVLSKIGERRRVSFNSEKAQAEGLDLYCSFDYPFLVDEVLGNDLNYYSMRYTNGKFGGARKFEPGNNGMLFLDYKWEQFFATEGTLSFFFKSDKHTIPQTILFFPSDDCAENILGINNDTLYLRLFIKNEWRKIEAPIVNQKQWNHAALVAKDNKLVFYFNGSAAGEIEGIKSMPFHRARIAVGGKTDMPFLGAIDELSIFSRALSDSEIRKLSRTPMSKKFANSFSFKVIAARSARSLYSLFSGGLRAVCRLNPFRSLDSVTHKDLPVIAFDFSKSDLTHFKKAHELSMLSGKRINVAQNLRKVRMIRNGEVVECYAYLDDVYGVYNVKPMRKGFVVIVPECIEEEASFELRDMFCLTPAELYHIKHPDAASLLPNDPSKLVKLYCNNELLGVYYLQEWESKGRGWMLSDKDVSPERILSYAHSGESTIQKAAETARKHILCDVFFPWSEAEVNAREKLFKEKQQKKNFAGGGLHEFDFLGGNSAPFMVEHNLEMPDGWEIESTSNPNVISLEGSVNNKNLTSPEFVKIKVRNAKDSLTGDLLYRVIPSVSKLHRLFLWIDSPLQKNTKQDFICEIQKAGEEVTSVNYGLSGSKTGIKHRGNTSYVKGRKRSLGIEFENPHGVIGALDSCHLFLVSGYSDRTRMRNAFTFEMFSRMNPGKNIAPKMTYVELCVNGEYAGVYEAMNRIDEKNLPTNIVSALRSRVGTNLFGSHHTGMFEEIVPRNDFGYGVTNYLKVVDLLDNASSEGFSSLLSRQIDIENVVDFYLILNFSQNMDMMHLNQILCFDAEGKLTIVPWDCDKTFNNRLRFRPCSNVLFDKCIRYSPEFKATVKERWAMHRSTLFTDESIDAWIREKQSIISDYMKYELENISTPFPEEKVMSFEECVEDFRQTILFYRAEMDKLVNSL